MKNRLTNGEIVNRFNQKWASRKTVEATWDVITRFVAPYRGRFFQQITSEHAIEWRHREIYDSTAVMAAQSLAASLHGALTTPTIRWFDMQFREKKLNKDQDAAEWLQNASSAVYDTLRDSNFNLEINEMYLDLVTFGTGFIVEEDLGDPLEDWGGVNFTCVPMKEAYFEQDQFGQVYAFYRLLNWQPSRYIDKFGPENCPQIVIDKYESNNDDERVEVVFAILPVWENADAPTGEVLAPERRPYRYVYLTRDSAEPFTGPAAEGGYYEMPVFAPKWRKTSESEWGNSPSSVALADILTLNQTIEMRIKSVEKLLDPPQKVEERALISDLDLKARGLTVLRDISKIQPLDTGANINAGEIEINDLRAAIRNYFFVDQLELKESPAMTATEVQIRVELMQRLIGPTLGRLESDLLDPLIQRTFNMLMRAGRLGPIPESLMDLDSSMDIEYLGPLARAQKTDRVASIERWMGSLGAYAEMGMVDVLDVPDLDTLARETGMMLNVPATMMLDEKTVKKARAARQEAQQQAQQAELMQQSGKGMQEMAAGAEATQQEGTE